MGFLSAGDRRFLEAASKIVFCNPFLPERIEYERAALGKAFDEPLPFWSLTPDRQQGVRKNELLLAARLERLLNQIRERLARGDHATDRELALYEDAVMLLLYQRFAESFMDLIRAASRSGTKPQPVPFYEEYRSLAQRYLLIEGRRFPLADQLPHLFACFYQIRRTFHHVFNFIVGGTMSAARLRAAVWQSCFTCDMRRYRDLLFDRMNGFSTLILGASGTGKELVARAVGMSRYLPFREKSRTFAADFREQFHPLNLSAFSPTLIESALFGHRRGAFTGALEDRDGWFGACGEHGAVFLDEIGELAPALQVKLLRVLQDRTFTRIGDHEVRAFQGKVIAATHRALPEMVRQGSFRQDLYYRICSDVIRTPSLQEHLAENPDEMGRLVRFLLTRIVGHDAALELGRDTEQRIREQMGDDYAWPGNMRELEQCVRNVLVRRDCLMSGRDALLTHIPFDARPHAVGELALELERGALTAEEVLGRYAAGIYARTGNYGETAEILKLDRRTVRKYVRSAIRAPKGRDDPEHLAK